MTTQPVVVLDRDDVMALLIAIGANRERGCSFTAAQYKAFASRSFEGAHIIGELQRVFRAAQPATEATHD